MQYRQVFNVWQTVLLHLFIIQNRYTCISYQISYIGYEISYLGHKISYILIQISEISIILFIILDILFNSVYQISYNPIQDILFVKLRYRIY